MDQPCWPSVGSRHVEGWGVALRTEVFGARNPNPGHAGVGVKHHLTFESEKRRVPWEGVCGLGWRHVPQDPRASRLLVWGAIKTQSDFPGSLKEQHTVPALGLALCPVSRPLSPAWPSLVPHVASFPISRRAILLPPHPRPWLSLCWVRLGASTDLGPCLRLPPDSGPPLPTAFGPPTPTPAPLSVSWSRCGSRGRALCRHPAGSAAGAAITGLGGAALRAP